MCENCSYNCKTLFSLCDSFPNFNFNFGIVSILDNHCELFMQFIFVHFRFVFKFETLFAEEMVHYATSDSSAYYSKKRLKWPEDFLPNDVKALPDYYNCY